MLEEYPETGPGAEKYVAWFAGGTLDTSLETRFPPVPNKKILNAVARVLGQGKHSEKAKEAVTHVSAAGSSSVHTSYAAIMQIYGGRPESRKFAVSGVPPKGVLPQHAEMIELDIDKVMMVAGFFASKLGFTSIFEDILKDVQQKDLS